MPMRYLLLALGLCLALPLRADIRYDLDDAAVVATVNGEPFSENFIDLMQRLARQSEPDATRAKVVQALVDDRLIAAWVRANNDAGEPLIEDNKVAFNPATQIEHSMVSNLQAGFAEGLQAALKREKGGVLDGVITAEHFPTVAEWRAVFGTRPGLMLEYALAEKARAAASKVILLRYRLGKTPGRISLLDVYDAQNIQGRNQLHARDGHFAREQARLLLRNRYILDWAKSADGLGEQDFAVLRRAVEDRLVHGGWMAHLGVAADLHDDPQHLKELQAAVTPDEIRTYYEAHRDDFRRIEKVKARHLRVADEAQARELEARLKKGESFDSLAMKHSMAPDAENGGDLGWIVHGEQTQGWLDSLAFLQNPGVPSRPVRTPGGPGEAPAWEILLVEERVMGWQPVDSESVRYLASQAIARQKAMQQYRATLEQVRREADVRLPRALLPLARKPEATGS